MAVILTILKWILRIILIILGLIILLMLIILFSGIRYSAEGIKNEKKTGAKGSIRYLAGIVSFRFMYKDGKLRWQAKVFKKVLASSGGTRESSPPEKRETKENSFSESSPDRREPVKETSSCVPEEEKTLPAPDDMPSKTAKDFHNQKSHTEKKASKLSSLKSKEIKFRRKIYGIIKKIKSLFEKKETLEDLLDNPVIQDAILKALDVLKKVLRKLTPKVLEGDVSFGLSDPYYTGKLLAYLSVVYPVIPGDFMVMPNFEEKCFGGRGRISGCFRLKTFVGAGISLLLNKNIRKSIKIFKNMKTTGGK